VRRPAVLRLPELASLTRTAVGALPTLLTVRPRLLTCRTIRAGLAVPTVRRAGLRLAVLARLRLAVLAWLRLAVLARLGLAGIPRPLRLLAVWVRLRRLLSVRVRLRRLPSVRVGLRPPLWAARCTWVVLTGWRIGEL
jgi:hypothetical protein